MLRRSRFLQTVAGAVGYELELKKKRKPRPVLTKVNESITNRKIHYACGKRYLEGWLNVDWWRKLDRDIVLVDLTKRHPFHDDFFEFGYSEDFLEHIQQGDSLIFLAEMFRTFRPGGVCRLAFPGMDGQVLTGPPFSDYESAKRVKDHFYDQFEHVHLYAKNEFELVCRHIGFSDVNFLSYHESPHDELRGLETREDVRD